MMRLLPKNESFFDDFDRHTSLIVSAAEILGTMTAGGTESIAELAARTKKLEEEGDEIVHRVVVGLRRSFITPLDRDDTHSLASHLDDILDLIEAGAYRLALFRLHVQQPQLTALVEQVKRSSLLIRDAVAGLRDKANHDKVLEICVEINQAENEADSILRAALEDLFANATDPLLVIKWKEVFETLEECTDRCEDVADVIENLLLES
jgi:predicted phosphate transport protein (TIGR00153 family)